MNDRIALLAPSHLAITALTSSCTENARSAVHCCNNALHALTSEKIVAELTEAKRLLGSIPSSLVQEANYHSKLPSFDQVSELNRYMRVDHVLSTERYAVCLGSWISALEATRELHASTEDLTTLWSGLATQLSLIARCGKIEIACSAAPLPPELKVPTPKTSDAVLHQWRLGHWTFFVITQGLIICLRRMKALLEKDPDAAALELDTATELMWASAAAMKITGAFTSDQYHEHVRPTMELGTKSSEVNNTSLSGVMTWDHRVLVDEVWRVELSGFFQQVPSELEMATVRFTDAYKNGLSKGHIHVCSKFGGGKMGSLIAPDNIATKVLKKIEVSRLDQITRD